MSDIAPISRSSGAYQPVGRRAVENGGATSASSRSSDSVEFSKASQLLSKLQELPETRTDLVERIRAEIKNGSYDTDDKLSAALDSAINDALG